MLSHTINQRAIGAVLLVMMLRRLLRFAVALLTAASASPQPPAFALRASAGQAPDARQSAQERAQAELDAPKLSAVLGLEPGMTVADVGAGFGAMTIALASRDKTGKFIATDIAERQLTVIRDYVKREGLDNVTVLQGGEASTNLPDACCDAVFLRLVYHHITEVASFNRSLFAALKPGGRLAIIDSAPDAGSTLPRGVPANREGHGIRTSIVIGEMTAAGFTVEQTIDRWPPGGKAPSYLLLFRKPRGRPAEAGSHER